MFHLTSYVYSWDLYVLFDTDTDVICLLPLFEDGWCLIWQFGTSDLDASALRIVFVVQEARARQFYLTSDIFWWYFRTVLGLCIAQMALEEMQWKNVLLLACVIPSVLPITISKVLPLGRHQAETRISLRTVFEKDLQECLQILFTCMAQPRKANLTEVRAHLTGWRKQYRCITMMHEAVIAESHTQCDSFLPSLTVSLETGE